MGDYAAAETALAPLLESGGAADGEVVFEHALILLATGRPQRAGETYRRLLEERPEVGADPERTLEFADAQLAAGEVDEALAAYRALAEFAVDPQRRQEIEIRAARALARGGRVGAALEAYDRVLSSAVGRNVAVVVTDRRALGLSPQVGGFFDTPILLGESIERVEAESNLATITTSRRLLVFRTPSGSWEIRLR